MAMINPPGRTPANSLKIGFEARLRVRAVLRDIYTNLSGLYNRTTQTIPNAIYTKIDEKVAAGANSLRITLQLPITGGAVEGNARMVGTEVPPQTKTVTLYRNNYGKAVPIENYGVNKLDQDYLGIYDKQIELLGDWAKQYRGRSIRTAILERYSPNLLLGNTAATCVPEWNPHFYVANCPHNQQPVYSSNMATYTNNIVNAISIASGGAAGSGVFTPSVAQTLSIRFVNNITRAAQYALIAPLEIAGNQAYILTISVLQANMNSDPTWKSDNLGSVWTSVDRMDTGEVQKWYGLQGVLKTAAGVDVYIVVDPKQPTILPTGSAAPFGLTAGYMLEADINTDMNLTNPNTRDTAFLLGKNAVAGWEPEKMHFENEMEEYDRIQGRGIKGVWGYQLPIYDQQNPTATSREYYGSMVGVLARPAYM